MLCCHVYHSFSRAFSLLCPFSFTFTYYSILFNGSIRQWSIVIHNFGSVCISFAWLLWWGISCAHRQVAFYMWTSAFGTTIQVKCFPRAHTNFNIHPTPAHLTFRPTRQDPTQTIIYKSIWVKVSVYVCVVWEREGKRERESCTC